MDKPPAALESLRDGVWNLPSTSSLFGVKRSSDQKSQMTALEPKADSHPAAERCPAANGSNECIAAGLKPRLSLAQQIDRPDQSGCRAAKLPSERPFIVAAATTEGLWSNCRTNWPPGEPTCQAAGYGPSVDFRKRLAASPAPCPA
jgi:hypothetical protein